MNRNKPKISSSIIKNNFEQNIDIIGCLGFRYLTQIDRHQLPNIGNLLIPDHLNTEFTDSEMIHYVTAFGY